MAEASVAGQSTDTADPIATAAQNASSELQQLPSSLPAEAYQGQQRAAFNRHVLPELLKRGASIDPAWKAFAENSLPGNTTNWPRLKLMGAAAKEAFVAPIAGALGDEETRAGAEEDLAQAHKQAVLRGVHPGGYEMVGGAIGAAPLFAPALTGAGAAIEGIGLTGAAAFGAHLGAGMLTQGLYDAAKAPPGQGVQQGVAGAFAPQTIALFGVGALAGALKGAHSNLSGSDADLIARTAMQPVGAADGTAADLKVQETPGIAQTIQQQVAQAKSKTQKIGTPSAPPTADPGAPLTVAQTLSNGQKFATAVTNPSLDEFAARSAEHWNLGGSLDEIGGEPTRVHELYQAVERAQNPNGLFDIPLENSTQPLFDEGAPQVVTRPEIVGEPTRHAPPPVQQAPGAREVVASPSARPPISALLSELESRAGDESMPDPVRNAAKQQINDISFTLQPMEYGNTPETKLNRSVVQAYAAEQGIDEDLASTILRGQGAKLTWKSTERGSIGANPPPLDKIRSLPNGRFQNVETGDLEDTLIQSIKNAGGTVKFSAKETGELHAGDVIGNANAPLTDKGIANAKSNADKFAAKGFGTGVSDHVISGGSERTLQTVTPIVDATGALYRGENSALKSRGWGGLEGQPEADVQAHIDRFNTVARDEVPEGVGAMSTGPGESTNGFLARVIPEVQREMARVEATRGRTVIGTNSSVLGAVRAWVNSGTPENVTKIDTSNLSSIDKTFPEGTTVGLFNDPVRGPVMRRVNMDEPGELADASLYFVRHEESGARTPQGVQNAPATRAYASRPIANRVLGGGAPDIPENAAGATFDQGPGARPTVWLATPDPATKIHENFHATTNYMGMDPAVERIVQAHPMFGDLDKAVDPFYKEYRGNELYAYAQQFFRMGDEEGIQRMVDADTDRPSVAGFVRDTTRQILSEITGQEDSVAKRVAQRQLGEVLRRAGGLEDAARGVSALGADLTIRDGQYALTMPDGAVKMFRDRESLATFADKFAGEPLTMPELVDPTAVPKGVPRFSIENGFNPARSADQGVPPDPDYRTPVKIADYIPSLHRPSFGTTIDSFIRPAYNFFDAASTKHNVPEIAEAAYKVQGGEIALKNARKPIAAAIAQEFKAIGPERGKGIMSYLQTTPDQRPRMAAELNLTADELTAAHNLENGPIADYNARRGDGRTFLDDFSRGFAQKMANAKYDFESFRAGSTDIMDKPLADYAKYAEEGEIDPREQDITQLLPNAWEQLLRKEYLEKPLQDFARLGNMVDKNGNALYGDLQPAIKRFVESFRGTPDRSARVIAGMMNSAIDATNWGIDKLNKLLPDNRQVSKIDTDIHTMEAMSRFLGYESVIGLGLRPGLVARAYSQILTTGTPILGGKYTSVGLREAFGPGKVSAMEEAAQFGALIDRDPIRDVLNKSQHGFLYKASVNTLNYIQQAHNGSRTVIFQGARAMAADALQEFAAKGDFDGFARASSLDFIGTNRARMFMNEARQLTDFAGPQAQDLTGRIAAQLTRQTQWDMTQGGQPGIYKYAMGRVLGQFGIYPMSYLEYARKLATSGDLGQKASRLATLAMTHSAVLAAGQATGIDTSHWVFTQPLVYTGSPTLQAIMNLPKAMDFQSPQGAEARAQLFRPTYWFEIPGGVEASKMAHAMAVGDPHDMFVNSIGLTPVRKGKQWF